MECGFNIFTNVVGAFPNQLKSSPSVSLQGHLEFDVLPLANQNRVDFQHRKGEKPRFSFFPMYQIDLILVSRDQSNEFLKSLDRC